MPISHIGLGTSDIEAYSKFYDAALAPLGYSIMMRIQDGKVLGYCDGTGPNFWIAEHSSRTEGADEAPTVIKDRTVHFAFDCSTREQVDAFYNAAM